MELTGVSRYWMNHSGLIGAFLRNMLIFRKRIRSMRCWRTLKVLLNTKRILISKIIPSFFTIKEGSTFLTKPLFNSLYDPFGSPSRGQKPQGREDVAGSAIAPPEFWSASRACVLKGWLGVLTQQSCEYLSAGALSNLLIACSFSAFFLVVSIKKLIFAEKFNV